MFEKFTYLRIVDAYMLEYVVILENKIVLSQKGKQKERKKERRVRTKGEEAVQVGGDG